MANPVCGGLPISSSTDFTQSQPVRYEFGAWRCGRNRQFAIDQNPGWLQCDGHGVETGNERGFGAGLAHIRHGQRHHLTGRNAGKAPIEAIRRGSVHGWNDLDAVFLPVATDPLAPVVVPLLNE